MLAAPTCFWAAELVVASLRDAEFLDIQRWRVGSESFPSLDGAFWVALCSRLRRGGLPRGISAAF